MKRIRYTESQIFQILKEAEGGVAPDLCRKRKLPRQVDKQEVEFSGR